MKEIQMKLAFLVLVFGLLVACNNTAKKDNTSLKETSETVVDNEPAINMETYFQAALNGNISFIEEAIDKGVDVNVRDQDQRTAMMLAAFNGHQHIVKLLIEKGADISLLDATKRSALMFASTGPFNPTVVELINAGAKVNSVDGHEEWTALMFAASEGQLDVVKTLLANGADINMVDVDGESAMYFANQKGHTHVVEFLKNYKK